MKKLVLLFVMFVSVAVSAETISGSVKDEKGNPMPFVTISVLAADSSLVTGAITDEEGRYRVEVTKELSANGLILQASFIGCRSAFGGPDFVLREETDCWRRWKSKPRNRLSSGRWTNWW